MKSVSMEVEKSIFKGELTLLKPCKMYLGKWIKFLISLYPVPEKPCSIMTPPYEAKSVVEGLKAM